MHWLVLEYESSPYNTKCRFTYDYPLEDRLKKAPFGKAKKVLLVSFEGGPRVEPLPGEKIDSTKVRSRLSLPLELPQYQGVAVYEVLALSSKQLDDLTNILFNYGFWRDRKSVIQMVGPTCYSPQHMLQFYADPKDTVPFAWVEICLDCLKHKVFPSDFDLGMFCDGKYDLLREFFRQAGIQHGLDGIK